MKRTGLVFALTILFASYTSVFAQKIIRGTVRNAVTNELLPTANIQVEGTFRGTTSNLEGRYALELKSLPATIKVSYIGYATNRVTITDESPSTIHLLLKPIVLEFKEIVVTGEDPAVSIMREVIKRKQEWQKKLKTFMGEAYTRLTLENDSSIVLIIENTSEVYWDREKGTREIIKSKNHTDNIQEEFVFIPAMAFSNFYDDDVEDLGNQVIGPTHPDALKHYNFKLVGQRSRDDKIVFDIEVTPKTMLQPTFTGRLAVLDQDYAMIEVELKPSKSVILPFPIDEWNVYNKQQFSNFGQEYWLPVDVNSNGDVTISMPGLSLPVIKYRQLTRFVNYQVNVPLPDSIYADKTIFQIDSVSVKNIDFASLKAKTVPLTMRETRAYETIDSTFTMEKAFKPKGFLARFIEITSSTDGSSAGDVKSDSSGFAANMVKSLRKNLRPQLRYNRVGELHVGLGSALNFGSRISLRFSGAYKTGQKEWAYGSGLTLRLHKRSNTYISFDYKKDIEQRYSSYNYPQILNSVLNVFGREDYFDYFWNEKYVVKMGHRIRPLHSMLTVSYNHEKHSSAPKTTDYDIVGRDYVQRLNPGIDEGNLRSIGLKLQIGEGYIPWGVLGQRRFELAIEHSSSDVLSSDFSFTSYQCALDWSINTFLRRRLMPNVFDIRIIAGAVKGELPLQRFNIIDGQMAIFSPYGSLKSLTSRPYEGEKYFALFCEHNFRTVPFELLGLNWFTEQRLSFIVTGAMGRTWIDDSRRNKLNFSPKYNDDFHSEVGIAVTGIYGLLRLDLTKRLDKDGFYAGLSLARMF